jgi:peptidoglycan/xylan/chitin deacetylase (PgdA/CDA1 family)
MSLKHRAKRAAREIYARVLFHTGLHTLVNRVAPRRLTILFGHCIEDDAINAFLPRDMTMQESTLRRVLGWFKAHGYALVDVARGVDALASGERGASLVALTMDDGYKDNRTRLLPVLQELGAGATIFLESRPLDERRVNWTHKFHWIVDGGDAERFAQDYALEARDANGAQKVRAAIAGAREKLVYRVKLALKYDVDHADRERVIDVLFARAGGDERALCDMLYMDWSDVRALAAGGVELGGHTVSHAIVSKLDDEGRQREIAGCRERLVRELGERHGRTFAYPFGRRWDYDRAAIDTARASGFELAVNTHAGTNTQSAARFELLRVPVDDRTPLHLLVAEACGGFHLLRRVGIDLSE